MRGAALAVVLLLTACSAREQTFVSAVADSTGPSEADAFVEPEQQAALDASIEDSAVDVVVEASDGDDACAPRSRSDAGIYARESYGCGAPPPSSDACKCGDKGFLHVNGDGPRRALATSCAQGVAIDSAACAKPTTLTACDDKGCLVLATWIGTSFGGHYVDRTGTCFALTDVKIAFEPSSAGGGDYDNGTFTATAESCGKKLMLSGDFRGCIVARNTYACE